MTEHPLAGHDHHKLNSGGKSIEPPVQDAVRAVQEQIIECLNRFYAMEMGMWGSPSSALVLRTVIQGDIQQKRYDLSALAAVLDLPIATAHRKVRELEGRGYLVRQAQGKSVYLAPTHKACIALDRSFEEMIETLRRLYRASGRAIDASVRT